jgi:hypothetical protein
LVEGEKEIGIQGPAAAQVAAHLYHNNTLESPVLKVWNESGTNRGRIGDSPPVRLRSLRHMAVRMECNTTSGVQGRVSLRFARKNVNAIARKILAASQVSYPCG